ncbi:MAG: 3-hydroxyacyl-CoA dehydrogenase family protein, partial [Deltaproteobacteria bacterium]|nr:3-hydroxyacyl-CoA dehydrogenase family protein [Deltaproteobacteria bacterium]
IKADETDEETMEKTMVLMADVGKKPVRVKKDVPGFLANRLQHALWREAISIVENGIADAAEVDEAVKNSFGLRLPVLGPMETADMAGLDLTLVGRGFQEWPDERIAALRKELVNHLLNWAKEH